jgi:TonB family protein
VLRKLPRPANIDPRSPYPDQARRQGLTGRVLVEFQIDRHGKAFSGKILGADAAEILQEAALVAIERFTFNVSKPGFDPADPNPFLVTVKFCLSSCGDIVDFPGAEEEIVITSSPLP